MPPRDIRALLHDIIEACRAVESLISASNLERYKTDRHLRASVEREFITIGEALRCAADLDESVENVIADTPKVIAFRNSLVHRYDKVDNEVVWHIASLHAPMLRSQAEELLASYKP